MANRTQSEYTGQMYPVVSALSPSDFRFSFSANRKRRVATLITDDTDVTSVTSRYSTNALNTQGSIFIGEQVYSSTTSLCL